MDDQRAQIVEKIKASNNFLVTVSTNPTVDQLAAAIGLTLLLGKLNKQATAVFSGEVPSVLRFLRPDKTLQKNPDNLQDFIISLDKAKADKLRYKVEDDVVRIFITPYKTSLSSKDLSYSKGDFNVEVVLALGVARKDDLDTAISAHGRILHDATVISVTNSDHAQLGTLHLEDTSVSGMSEMVMGLVRDLGNDLLDDRIATALLTGIVAATDFFGNDKTTPMTLTASADLLEAGANQQLVSTELGHKDRDGGKPGQHAAGGSGQQLKSYKQIAREQGKDRPAQAEKPFHPQQPALKDMPKSDNRLPAPVAPMSAPDNRPPALTPPEPAEKPATPAIELPPATPERSAVDDLLAATPTPAPLIDPDKTLTDLEAEVSGPTDAEKADKAAADKKVEESTDVDSARKAVESALSAPAAESPADSGARLAGLPIEPAASELEAAAPAPAPETQSDLPDFLKTPSMTSTGAAQPPAAAPPLPPNPAAAAPQAIPMPPSPVSPAEPPKPAQPHNPAANEQAPLSMSPADQPFTMPLPPAPAAAASVESDELPPALQGSSAAGPPPGPPPIPPSMPPPGPGSAGALQR